MRNSTPSPKGSGRQTWAARAPMKPMDVAEVLLVTPFTVLFADTL